MCGSHPLVSQVAQAWPCPSHMDGLESQSCRGKEMCRETSAAKYLQSCSARMKPADTLSDITQSPKDKDHTNALKRGTSGSNLHSDLKAFFTIEPSVSSAPIQGLKTLQRDRPRSLADRPSDFQLLCATYHSWDSCCLAWPCPWDAWRNSSSRDLSSSPRRPVHLPQTTSPGQDTSDTLA